MRVGNSKKRKCEGQYAHKKKLHSKIIMEMQIKAMIRQCLSQPEHH